MRGNDLRTVFNLAAAPNDLSPVANYIVATAKEALAADQRIVVLAGEEHATIACVRLAEILRGALCKAGIQKTAIAGELPHNFLEAMPFDSPDEQAANHAGFLYQAREILRLLKEDDPPRYHKLQALSHAAEDWTQAPLAHHANFKTWLENDVPVHLIDAACCGDNLDRADPETAEIVKAHEPGKKGNINTKSPTGVHLRNRFMAARIQHIMAQNDAPPALIVQTGFGHLGGEEKGGYPYEESLHGILAAEAAVKNVRLVTLLSETYESALSAPARAAMNNADTIILRGLDENRHLQRMFGSFESEAATLSMLYERSGRIGMPPALKDEAAYRESLAATEEQLTAELKNAVARYYAP